MKTPFFLSFCLILLGTTNCKANLKQLAQNEQSNLLSLQRLLHENPELRWEENNSIALLREKIKKIQPQHDRRITIYDHFTGGLVVDLNVIGKQNMKLFRADLDALPVQENLEHIPCSQDNGKMHACGHDIHSATLFSALKILATNPTPSESNIRFVWQRAEENPGTAPNPHSGGYVLVQENVLEGISEVYGLHIWSMSPAGQFESCPGAFFGNSARIYLEVEAEGGHASQPHKGGNALWVILELRRILEDTALRKKDPMEVFSIEPVVLHSGKAANVMPTKAKMWFSFRNLLQTAERDALFSELKACLSQRAAQLNARVTIKLISGPPTLINSPSIFKKTKKFLEQEMHVKEVTPLLAGEDFAYYLQECPGCFWLLGAYQDGTGPHHSPTFKPDTNVFWQGIWFWLKLAYAL